jgi:glycosyltransferase involved in cell wall biosynthesis
VHVLHLIKSLGLGGAENLLLEAARHPSPRGVRYGFGYFLPWKDALVEPLREAGAEVACFPARTAAGILARVPAVARHLRARRVDLLHCHLPLSGVAGRLAGRLAGVPVVYTEHNLLERYHPLTRAANLATWRLQRQVVAVSAEVAASIAGRAGGSVPVQVVANGVPVDRLRRDPEAAAALRRELGIPAEAPVVGQVAVFRRQKRLDLWLEAAREIHRQVPESRFLLVGDGPLREDVEAWAAASGLGDALHLAGLQSEIVPYLSAIDLLMISSDFEGLPLVLLEAMALERPVVSTAVGGIAEAVADGETGVLVAPGEAAALARAAVDLLRQPQRRQAMGEAARQRVERSFGTRRMLAELEQLYGRVLGGAGAGRLGDPPRPGR